VSPSGTAETRRGDAVPEQDEPEHGRSLPFVRRITPDGACAAAPGLALDEPHALEFEDGLSDDSGSPDPDLPVTRASVSLEPAGSGTRVSRVSSREEPEDAILAEG
jgi:hypothetical protein